MSSIKIVAIALATCPMLSLSLGPLDLSLLGLVLHLDEVNLTIDAGSGRATCSAICCVLRPASWTRRRHRP
ncbi:MAG TPA: hypothetical protein VEX66_06215 [Microlunatus sp.]|nr:hypothetical protein [Microlunatus sp.]